MPETWGTFILVPTQVTFWQLDEKLLHHRIVYEGDKTDDVSYKDVNRKWTKTRTTP